MWGLTIYSHVENTSMTASFHDLIISLHVLFVVCHNHNLVLSSFTTGNTTGTSSGTGCAYPSRAPRLTYGFSGVRVNFWFSMRSFVENYLTFFLWSLYCLASGIFKLFWKRGDGCAHITILALPLFIEVPVSSQKSERSCTCMLGVSICLSTIFLFDFGSPHRWDFHFILLPYTCMWQKNTLKLGLKKNQFCIHFPCCGGHPWFLIQMIN